MPQKVCFTGIIRIWPYKTGGDVKWTAPYIPLLGTAGLAVMASVLHTEGRRFDPAVVHFLTVTVQNERKRGRHMEPFA